MLSDLLPKNLTGAARTLGVDPFEVVRLLVASDKSRGPYTFGPADVEALQLYGDIENWWPGIPVPDDTVAPRARIRAVVAEMLRRRLVGDRQTRLDNLWRGLPDEERQLLEDGVDALCDLGMLGTHASASGIRISMQEDAVPHLKPLASGERTPPELERLWS